MSEDALSPGMNQEPVVAPQLSAGTMLRNLREAAGVDLALVASTIKVAPQKLQALEEDRLDQLPGITFARGLAAAVCRAFGVDPQPVLDAMPSRSVGLHAVAHPPLEATFRRPGDAPAPLLSSKASRAVLGVVVVLLVAAAALWFWPTLPIHLGTSADSAAVDSTGGSVAVPLESGSVERGEVADATPPADSATSSEDVNPAPAKPSAQAGAASDASATSAAPASQSAAAAESAGGAGNTKPATAAAAATGGADIPPQQEAGAQDVKSAPAADPQPAAALALEATGDSWVGVRDAAGQTLLNRTLSAGEKVSLDGELPLSVVIGRKNAVRVRVHGEPFDDTSQSSSTVSRFQVK